MSNYLNAIVGVSFIIATFFMILGLCNGLQSLLTRESKIALNANKALSDGFNHSNKPAQLKAKNGFVYAYWSDRPSLSGSAEFNVFDVANIHLVAFTSIAIALILLRVFLQELF